MIRVVALILLLYTSCSSTTTVTPTSMPSLSMWPTSTPTPEPTPEPTLKTSKPTNVGDTNQPSSTPTSTPTFYYQAYKNSTLSYAIYAEELNRIQQKFPMTYSYFSYKDRIVEGSCDGLKAFVSSGIHSPFIDNMNINSVSLLIGNEDIRINYFTSSSSFCNDSLIVPNLVNNFYYGTNYSVLCGDHLWRTYSCPSGERITCLDCDADCSICPKISFSMRPCAKGCSAKATNLQSFVSNMASYSILAYGVEIKQMFPSFTKRPYLLSKDETSASFNVSISDYGNVYCTAILTKKPLPVSVAAMGANIVKTSMYFRRHAIVTISNLLPDTTYKLYCSTSDFLGNFMNMQMANEYSVQFTTDCCRNLRFSPSKAIIASANYISAVQQTFSISVHGGFSEKCIIQLTSVPTGVTFLPSSQITIDPNFSPDFTQTFRLKVTNIGMHTVMASTSNCGQGEVIGDILEVFVYSATLFPTPPELQSAILTRSGTELDVTFSGPTDQAGSDLPSSFNCSRIFFNKVMNSLSCIWKTYDTVSISLEQPYSNLLLVGDNLLLRSGILRAACDSGLNVDCNNYPTASTSSVNITMDPTACSVIADLSFPSHINKCDSLLIDITGSSGSCGQLWNRISFVAKSGPYKNITVAALQAYLNNLRLNNTLTIIRVPFMNFDVGNIHITMYLENYYGNTGAMTRLLKVVSDPSAVSTKISGLSLTSIYTWQELNLIAQIGNMSCVQTFPKDSLSFKWTVFEGMRIDYSKVSTSLDPRIFKLPSYSLSPGSMLTLQVSVIVNGNFSWISTYSIQVWVLPSSSPVKLKLISPSNIVIKGADSFVLDASGSYNIDYPSAPLTYLWKCLEHSPSLGSSCPTNVLLYGQPINTIAANLFSLGSTTLVFYVSVGDIDGLVVGQFYVTIIGDFVVTGSLNVPSSKFSSSSNIIVDAAATVPDGLIGLYTWSSLDIDMPAQATSSDLLVPSNWTGAFQLILPVGSLLPGKMYRFVLHARTFQNSLTDTSQDWNLQILVSVNTPPFGGVLQITPSRGTALTTVFEILSAGWVDDPQDLPLTYDLYYYVYDLSHGTDIVTTKTVASLSAFTILAQGLSSNKYIVTVVATVKDILGDMTSVSKKVTVLPLPNAQFFPTNLKMFNSFQRWKDRVSSSLTTSATITATTNNIDCGSSPNCDSLNRYICSDVSNTCGECLEGYFGVSGSANLPCMSTSNVIIPKSNRGSKSILQSSSLPTGSVGAPCVSATDCISGQCKRYYSGKFCASFEKTCYGYPTSVCRRRGTCVYIADGMQNRSSCGLNDISCRAICSCNSGFYGRDCARTSTSFEDEKTRRQMLCKQVEDNILSQDINENTIFQLAWSVSMLLSDMSLVTESAYRACSRAVIDILHVSPELAVYDESNARVSFRALSAILSGRYFNFISVDEAFEIAEIINNIADAYAKSSISYKNGYIETPLFRVNRNDAPGFAAEVQNFRLMQSYMDVLFYSYEASHYSLQNNGLSLMKTNSELNSNYNQESLRMSFVQFGFPMDIFNISYASSSAYLVRVSFKGNSKLSSLITFANQNPINYTVSDFNAFKDAGERGVVYCLHSRKAYNVTRLCYSKEVVFTCNGKTKGFYAYNCSSLTQAPVCVSMDPKEAIDCKLHSFTNYNTTCACSSSSVKLLSYVDKVYKPFESKFIVTETYSISPINITYLILVSFGLVGLIAVGVIIYSGEKVQLKFEKITDGEHEIGNIFTSYASFMSVVFPSEFFEKSYLRRFSIYFRMNHFMLRKRMPNEVVPFEFYYSNQFLYNVCHALHIGALAVVVTLLTFWDNGSCEANLNEGSCTVYSPFRNNRCCSWNEKARHCSFDSSRLTMSEYLLYTIVVLLLSIPLNQLLRVFTEEFASQQQRNTISGKNKGAKVYIETADTESVAPLSAAVPRLDRLKNLTTKMTYLLAARADKMNSKMQKKPFEELRYLLLKNPDLRCEHLRNREYGKEERIDMNIFNLIFRSVRMVALTVLSVSQIFRFDAFLKSSLSLERLKIVHRSAKQAFSLLSNDNLSIDAKEVFLLRFYFLEGLLPFGKCFLTPLFLREFNALNVQTSYFSSFLRRWLVILFVSDVSISLFFVLYVCAILEETISSAIILFVLSYVADIFLVSPTRLFLQFLCVDILSFEYSERFKRVIETRAKHILKRTHGLINFFNDFVQHFNPACRAARMYPQLSVSKMLMAVNDADVCVVLRSNNFRSKGNCVQKYAKEIFFPVLKCMLYFASSVCLLLPADLWVCLSDLTITFGMGIILYIVVQIQSAILTLMVLSLFVFSSVIFILDSLGIEISIPDFVVSIFQKSIANYSSSIEQSADESFVERLPHEDDMAYRSRVLSQLTGSPTVFRPIIQTMKSPSKEKSGCKTEEEVDGKKSLSPYERARMSRAKTLESIDDTLFQYSLIAFYQKHNKMKLKDVPGLLMKYKGRRIDLIADLEIKYKTVFVIRDINDFIELAEASLASSLQSSYPPGTLKRLKDKSLS